MTEKPKAKKTATKKTTTKKVDKPTITIKYSLQEELNRIQKAIKAPKAQENSYGKFQYRSAEDILEAYKKVQGNTVILLGDKIVELAGKLFVRAEAQIRLGDEKISIDAYAELPEQMKGMNASQVTGSASSYARKYALNGLLAIDDAKDADSVELTEEEKKAQTVMDKHQMEISMIDTEDGLGKYYNLHKEDTDIVIGEFNVMVTKRKRAIQRQAKEDSQA